MARPNARAAAPIDASKIATTSTLKQSKDSYTKDSSVFDNAMSRVEAQLTNLSEKIDLLEKRLAPVMAPSSPVGPSASDVDPSYGSSPIVGIMRILEDRVFDLNSQASELLFRLEI